MFLDGAHGWNIDIDMRTVRSRAGTLLRELERLGSEESHICTLLGPEGPEQLGRYVLVDLILLDFFSLASLAGGKGTARTLRTTQWTRAS